MDNVKDIEKSIEMLAHNLSYVGNAFYSSFKHELDELAFLINAHKQDLEIENGNGKQER